jgi:uncharacterized protein (TIGR02391 family)
MELEELMQLEPEELGWVLLRNLRERRPEAYASNEQANSRTVQYHDAKTGLEPTIDPNDRNSNRILMEHSRVLVEGWQWLEHEGLITVDPAQNNTEFKVITRRGQAISTQEVLIDFAAAKLIPHTLHTDILPSARSQFIRKDYETAIMHAYRSVEIAVRHHGGLAAGDVGVSLMRAAFRPAGNSNANNPVGTLTDTNAEPGEQQGMMELFAGAMACFRNPSAHRLVNIDKHEAIELLCFASRLLHIVDQRAPNP